MRILAIDPGLRHTGWVSLSTTADGLPEVRGHAVLRPEGVLSWLRKQPEFDVVVIEKVGHYGTGMAAGADVFDTCFLIGRMQEALRLYNVRLVKRQSIKAWLCGTASAKDSNVRQALIDRWGGDTLAIGAVKCPACKGKGWIGRGRPICETCGGSGWEVEPGPLHGIATHEWSALAAGCYVVANGGIHGDSSKD